MEGHEGTSYSMLHMCDLSSWHSWTIIKLCVTSLWSGDLCLLYLWMCAVSHDAGAALSCKVSDRLSLCSCHSGCRMVTGATSLSPSVLCPPQGSPVANDTAVWPLFSFLVFIFLTSSSAVSSPSHLCKRDCDMSTITTLLAVTLWCIWLHHRSPSVTPTLHQCLTCSLW